MSNRPVVWKVKCTSFLMNTMYHVIILFAFSTLTCHGHSLRLQSTSRWTPCSSLVLKSQKARGDPKPLQAFAMFLHANNPAAGWSPVGIGSGFHPVVVMTRSARADSTLMSDTPTGNKADNAIFSSRAPEVKRPRKLFGGSQFPRIPVWPMWYGIFYTILDLIGQKELAAKLEDTFGGRVCPMLGSDEKTSDPFMLIAHHRHSWLRYDPLRSVFAFFSNALAGLDEGFSAHPHRGMETVTYVLPGRGGLIHRDSMGVKMEYGDGECQWMTAGSGLWHEEVFSNDRRGSDGWFINSELYQIWVNLPAKDKMTPPRVQFLRPSGQPGSTPPEGTSLVEIPTASPSEGVTVRVISGEVGGISSKVETFSDVSIMHTTMDPGSTWDLPLPPDFTALVYVRKGNSLVSLSQPIRLHELAGFERAEDLGSKDVSVLPDGIRLTNEAEDPSDVADVLLLAGRPLKEPVARASNFVMNTQEQLEQAERDFSVMSRPGPWEITSSDEEWKAHVSGKSWYPPWMVKKAVEVAEEKARKEEMTDN